MFFTCLLRQKIHSSPSADGVHQAWDSGLEEGEEGRANVKDGRKTVTGGKLHFSQNVFVRILMIF